MAIESKLRPNSGIDTAAETVQPLLVTPQQQDTSSENDLPPPGAEASPITPTKDDKTTSISSWSTMALFARMLRNPLGIVVSGYHALKSAEPVIAAASPPLAAGIALTNLGITAITGYFSHIAKNHDIGVNFHPAFGNKAFAVAQQLEKMGYKFVLSSGVRSQDEQNGLRSRLGSAGGPPAAAKDSMHSYGMACDFGYRGGGGGEAQFYRDLARIARAEGLESGMDYHDKYHICIPRDQFHALRNSGTIQHIAKLPAAIVLAQAGSPRVPGLGHKVQPPTAHV